MFRGAVLKWKLKKKRKEEECFLYSNHNMRDQFGDGHALVVHSSCQSFPPRLSLGGAASNCYVSVK